MKGMQGEAMASDSDPLAVETKYRLKGDRPLSMRLKYNEKYHRMASDFAVYVFL